MSLESEASIFDLQDLENDAPPSYDEATRGIVSAANTPICQRNRRQLQSQEEATPNCFQQPKHFYSKPIRAKCSQCNKIVLTKVEKVPGKWAFFAGLTCFCLW